jgi:putative ABC transport system permease protein
LLLLVACAIAGALLAAGATALAVAVTGRRRAFELAALRAVGLSRRGLLRGCVGEQLILLGTGFVLGLPAGLIAARLVLPAIPESSDASTVPLTYAPQSLVMAIFVSIVAALLVATALIAGRFLMRSAVPDRLREAAP